ncbi:MAG TPA: ATPase domain-containing protein [Burkholderiales bacterium]|nr:ATPase domain-containing protein [Burkholderiales bacterium]
MSKNRVATGIAGLDNVLDGGLTANRIYLIEGDPGSGKTTVGLQFLLEGRRAGEHGMYVSLSETKEELDGVAQSHGWSLDGIHCYELLPSDDSLNPDAQSRLFHPSEVELSDTTRSILGEVARRQPRRVVFDSLSEMRLLAQHPLRYRRQVLALKQFFIGRQCTVLLLDDRTSAENDLQLHSLAHGVITLQHLAQEYGAERRRLRVVKMRGSPFRGGYHDFIIRTGGLEVFPRLVAAEHHRAFPMQPLASGVAELDALLGGGLDRGTSTLLMGPAGSGKSTISAQFVCAAAANGEKSIVFSFDEGLGTLLGRAKGLGLNVARSIESGHVKVQQVDPAELSPGQFIHAIRRAVEEQGARLVVIDSLNGYMNAMPEERFLTIQLHEMLTYLAQQGVVTIMVVAQQGLLGSNMQTPVDASYLADTVIALRYFESQAKIRRAVSVIKKRSGRHEDTLRELKLGNEGLQVGGPLEQYHGVLSGIPSSLSAPA